jgi:hypothetical protein
MIPLLSAGVILILVIVSITVIIMKYRNSKDIKLKSEKKSKNEDFYDDIKNECDNDYAEPNYDQNYEDGSRYEYNFSVPPKSSNREQEIEESVGEDQPYYTSLYAKEDNDYINMRNMTPNA